MTDFYGTCFYFITYSLICAFVTYYGMSQAARLAGWLPEDSNLYPKASHVGFGLVLGSDGKRFRTRSSEVVRLVELLDEAKDRSKAELKARLQDNGNWLAGSIDIFKFEFSS